MEKDYTICVLEEVAEKHGVLYREVVQEIEAAVSEAIQNAKNESNAEALCVWMNRMQSEETPSAEVVVEYLSRWIQSFYNQ